MRYVIQLISTPNICLGVSSPQENAAVVQMPLDGTGTDTTQWYLDPNTGLVQLVADQRLFLGVQNAKLSSGAHLIVERFVLGRTTQAWNWTSSPDFVLSRHDTSYCIDSNEGRNAGTQTLAFPKGDNNPNQKWRVVSVGALAGGGKAMDD